MSKTSKFKKYIHEGFSWNLRGPVNQKSKAFVLAATGGQYPETKPGEYIDWEDLAIRIAWGQEIASKPLREAKKGGQSNG